mgnify:FL=1
MDPSAILSPVGVVIGDRRWWGVALAVYSVFLALVLLSPGSGAQSTSVGWFADAARAVGVPDRFTTASRAEFVANALILMPVSALGSIVWPRTDWRDWTAWAFVIAASVELFQGLFLPERSATMVDVVANTLGGLLGAIFVLALRQLNVLDERSRS